jgi:hypothetical protein
MTKAEVILGVMEWQDEYAKRQVEIQQQPIRRKIIIFSFVISHEPLV